MLQLNDILIQIIFILLHLFVFLFTYRLLEEKIFQPAVIFSLVWLVIIAMRFLFKITILDELEPISLEAYLIFFTGTVFFSVGSIIMNGSLKKLERPVTTTNNLPDISLSVRAASVAIIVIGLPFYIQAAIKIFLASQLEDFFVGLRYQISYEEADIGPLKYLMPLAYVILALNLYAYYKDKTRMNIFLLIITLLVTIAYAILATGRTFFFMILVIYLAISYLANIKFTLKKYAAALGGFLIIFVLIGIVLGKGGSTEDSIKDNLHTSAEFLGIYLVTSLNAFDKQLHQHTEGTSNGDNSLRFFMKAGMQLELLPRRKIADPSSQEFVFVPYPTNVYTYYNFYMLDFGRMYAWIMLAVFGALHTWLFRIAVYAKNKRAMLYYTFLLFPLMLSFFSDLYLSLFSLWVQIVFFTEMVFFANKLVLKRKLRWQLQRPEKVVSNV